MTPLNLRDARSDPANLVDRATARMDPAVAPDAATLRLREVHRAVAELRRGTPVLLTGGSLTRGGALVVLPAETAGARGLAEFNGLAAGAPVLLLAPVRAAAVLRRPVAPSAPAMALRTSPALLHQAVLLGLADPTAEQMLPEELALAAECPALAPAALALAKLARLLPAVLAAPAHDNAAARAATLHLMCVSADAVLAYPAGIAEGLRRVAEVPVPLDGAPDARLVAFRAPDSGIEHLAILIGRPEDGEEDVAEGGCAPLARVHSECFTGDLLGSLRCDCGPQLRGAIQRMAHEGAGVLLYLAQEGREIGLMNKLRAYAMQDRGMDTLDANRALGWGADERNFLIAATMLEELGIHSIRLLTNNPAKVAALQACGLRSVTREPHAFEPNGVNNHYLATKAVRFGHLLG